MTQAGMILRRGQVVAVLLANAILWAAAIYLTGSFKLGGPAAIALISIGTLFKTRPQAS